MKFPYRLWAAWMERRIGDEGLRELMFGAAGVIIDEPLPDGVELLYRGAALNRERGFSWTWDIEKARWFANRSARFGFPAGVFEVTYHPRLVLAVLGGEETRGEREVVVNPNRLRGRWSPRQLGQT